MAARRWAHCAGACLRSRVLERRPWIPILLYPWKNDLRRRPYTRGYSRDRPPAREVTYDQAQHFSLTISPLMWISSNDYHAQIVRLGNHLQKRRSRPCLSGRWAWRTPVRRCNADPSARSGALIYPVAAARKCRARLPSPARWCRRIHQTQIGLEKSLIFR